MANDYFTKTFRVTNSAVKLFNTIKPFHTQVLEVVERYVFEEKIIGRVTDSMQLKVTYRPKPDCDGEGWGTYYDNTFCGYDASKCCEPFNCTGGFGIVWDNTSIFASRQIVEIDDAANAFVLDGNVATDIYLPIARYMNIRTIRVKAPASAIDLFVGDGETTPSHILFGITGKRLLDIVATDPVQRRITVDSKTPNDIPSLVSLVAADGVKRHVSITKTSTNAQGLVVLHLDASSPLVDETTAQSGARIEITQTTDNNGTYSLWNRVTSAPGVTPITYSATPNATINESGYIDLIIDDQFPSPVEFDKGSIVLRNAMTYPRRIHHGDHQYVVISSMYNADEDQTAVIVSDPITTTIADGNTIELRGFDGGTGFDGFPTCAPTSDTLLSPFLREGIAFTLIQTALPPAKRLAQSTMRFSAPRTSTRVTRLPLRLETLPLLSSMQFSTPEFVFDPTALPRPRRIAITAVSPEQEIEVGDELLLTAIIRGALGGHFFEWEQTSGDPIPLTSVPGDVVTATGDTTGVEPGEYAFRFYADRGTVNELFADTTVHIIVNARVDIPASELDIETGDVEAIGGQGVEHEIVPPHELMIYPGEVIGTDITLVTIPSMSLITSTGIIVGSVAEVPADATVTGTSLVIAASPITATATPPEDADVNNLTGTPTYLSSDNADFNLT